MKSMRSALPFLALFVPAFAPAITLTTPYDLGDNNSFITTVNGDTALRGTPSVIGVDDARALDLQDRLMQFFPAQIPDPSVVTIGSALTGTVRVRTFNVGSSLDDESGRYFMGSNFRLEYDDGNGSSDVRWSVLYLFATQGTTGGAANFAEGFANRPTYYSDEQEAGQHDASGYVLDSNIYSLSTPGDYDYEIQAFLISSIQAADGTFSSITIHDGVSLPVALHLAPVPEPASMAALGLGAVALLRRRRKV